jgi:NAD(P)-dependent dehydrogenase (short-subunit alcohol dehydrogenase family)
LGNAIAVSFAREGATAVVIVDIGDLTDGKKTVEAYGTEVRVDLSFRSKLAKGICPTYSVWQSKQTLLKKKTSNERLLKR